MQDRYIHLSGFETGLRRILGDTQADSHIDRKKISTEERNAVILGMMKRFAATISRMTEGIGTTVLVGGVSESTYIRNALADNPDIVFGEAGMGRDNAVGIARLGNRVLWQDDPSVSIN